MQKLNYLLLLVIACFFQSCQVLRYQLCETDFDKNMRQEEHFIVYENDDCTVSYDFWTEKGLVKFFFYNKTDSVIMIDMTKTFLVKNGLSQSYFMGREWESSTTVANTKHSSFGYTNAKGNSYNTARYSTRNLTLNSLANLNVSSYNTSYQQTVVDRNSLTTKEQNIVYIAPHSAYYIAEFDICKKRFKDCDLEDYPQGKKISTINFEEESSPLKFVNYITYKVGNRNKEDFVLNKFYIKKLTNLVAKHIRKTQSIEKCGKKTGETETIYVFPIENFSNTFYFQYYEFNPGGYWF